MRQRPGSYSIISVVALCLALIATGQPHVNAGAAATPDLGALRRTMHPAVSEAQTDRFVRLWSRRIESRTFQTFLDTPGIPPEIAAEGFHSLDQETKGFLIVALTKRLLASMPDVRARVEGPDGARELALLETFLYEFIFAKESIEAGRTDAPKPQPAAAAATEKVPSDGLLAEVDRMRSNAAPVDGFVHKGAAGELASMPALAEPQLKGAPLPAQAIAPPITDVLRQIAGPNADYLTQSYRLCAAEASVCSGPTNIGAPATLDVTGDGVPDLAGSVNLLPDVSLSPGLGLRFEMSVERLALSVKDHVYAAIDLGPLQRRITVGLDGRSNGLAVRSTFGFTLRNLLVPVPGSPDLDIALDIRQVDPSGEVPVTVGTASLPNADDPLLVSIRPGGAGDYTGEAIVRKTEAGLHIGYLASSALTLQAYYSDPSGQSVTATLQDLPSQVALDVSLAGADRSVTWDASAPITSIALDDVMDMGGRRWWGGLRIDQIPAHWRVDYSQSGATAFTAPGSAVGSVAGYLSTYGPTGLPDVNFVYGNFETPSNNLLAGFRINQIRSFTYTPSSQGWTVNVQAGGGAPLYVYGQLLDTVANNRVMANVVVDPLPTDFTITQTGSSFTYDADRNLTLSASLEAGFVPALDAAPSPEWLHGVSVTDAWRCAGPCGYGVKASLYLTGMPSHLGFDGQGQRFEMRNWAPSVDSLRIEATLDEIHDGTTALPKVYLGLIQKVPTDTPLDIVADFAQTDDASSKKTTVSYQATDAGTDTLRDLGRLDVLATYGRAGGYLGISNIPGRIVGTVDFRNGTTDLGLTLAPNGISRIDVLALLADTIRAGMTLTDVPSSLSLSFGRQGDPNGVNLPGMRYAANADTLDIAAFVDAALFDGAVTARALFGVTNLGRSTTATFDSDARQLAVNSSPVTDRIELDMWGRISYGVDYGACLPSCDATARIRIDNGEGRPAHAGIEPLAIDRMGFSLADVRTFTLTLGFTSAIQGNYGSFTLGWDQISLRLAVDVRVRAELDLGLLGTFGIDMVDWQLDTTFPADVVWHLATNDLAVPDYSNDLFHINTHILCTFSFTKHFYIDTKISPHPRAQATNRFTVSAASAEGGAWLMTPDPYDIIPDVAVFWIARFATPLQGDQAVDFPCS